MVLAHASVSFALCSFRRENGVEPPVSYFSKKFNQHQNFWSTIENEALGLILALKHYKVYGGGPSTPVVVYSI